MTRPDPTQSVNGITAYTPDAKGELTNYLASRALIERVMREKLLETHGNVSVRWASPAASLQHGVGDDKGCITGARILLCVWVLSPLGYQPLRRGSDSRLMRAALRRIA